MPRDPQHKMLERMHAILRGERPDDADRKERILAGAAKAFRALSLREARVEDVLEAAETSRGTFYRFFRSKEDVALALFELALSLLAFSLAGAVATAEEPNERWERAVDAFLALEIEHGALVHELLTEAGRVDSRIGDAYASALDRAVELLRTVLGKRAGKAPDAWLVRAMILGVTGVVEQCHRQGRFDKRDAARVRQVAQALLGGVPSALREEH